jgi:large subunit ribosomal protein L3
MTGLWGKKIGMTQVFVEKKAVPVTVVDISHWYIINFKNVERDGYDAVQIGRLRPRYQGQPFAADWLKQLKTHFSFVREAKLDKPFAEMNLEVGKPADFLTVVQKGDKVDAFGTSKGRGFAGAVKRHGFRGAPASHGAKMGKRPGSLSWMRSQGRVPKGKRLPGHLGNVHKVIRNLEVITLMTDDNVVLIKGSVPGKTGSLVFLRKA